MTDTVTVKVRPGRGMTIGDALATVALLAFAGVGYWQGWRYGWMSDLAVLAAVYNALARGGGA